MPKISNSKGLTLIEVMISLAIVSSMVGIGISKFRLNTTDLKKTVRGFRLLTKRIHSYAKLQNTTYRLVIDLARDEDRPEDQNFQSYWVEVSSEPGIIFESDKELKTDDPDTQKASQFKPATKILKKKVPLPRGLQFTDLEIQGMDRPQTKGRGYIHFSPQGLVDESIIHVMGSLRKDESFSWSIAIHPLTGKAKIFPRKILLKDLRER